MLDDIVDDDDDADDDDDEVVTEGDEDDNDATHTSHDINSLIDCYNIYILVRANGTTSDRNAFVNNYRKINKSISIGID